MKAILGLLFLIFVSSMTMYQSRDRKKRTLRTLPKQSPNFTITEQELVERAIQKAFFKNKEDVYNNSMAISNILYNETGSFWIAVVNKPSQRQEVVPYGYWYANSKYVYWQDFGDSGWDY